WGTLPSADLIRQVEEQARQVLGVLDVRSELRVRPVGDAGAFPTARPPPRPEQTVEIPPNSTAQPLWRPAQGRRAVAAPPPTKTAPSTAVSRPLVLGPGWSPPPPRDAPPGPGVRLLPSLAATQSAPSAATPAGARPPQTVA